MNNIQLIHGDCLDKLKELEDNSVDSIVTDPPYGIKFMSQKWDYEVPSVEVWRECYRVLKPGGHLLSFAGTRTYHRMAVNVEDVGFEIRDMISWLYGQGFPKSQNIGKAIDKLAGAEREVIGQKWADKYPNGPRGNSFSVGKEPDGKRTAENTLLTAPATEEAKQYEGFGTALKPACEPVVMARKPLSEGTVAKNVLKWGTGAININGCRISHNEPEKTTTRKQRSAGWNSDNCGFDSTKNNTASPSPQGRFPANLIHDGSEEVTELFPNTGKSSGGRTIKRSGGSYVGGAGDNVKEWSNEDPGYGDTGSAARFFYCAKASKTDRDEGLEEMQDKLFGQSGGAQQALKHGKTEYQKGENASTGLNTIKVRKNNHPTVKPLALMQYLVRLVTPPNGTVLDPFMGSGSTGKACVYEGFGFIGIDLEEEYVEIARARVEHAKSTLDKQTNIKAEETLNKFFSD